MEVAGTAVGIASLGIQVCQGILDYYDAWKEYRKDIRDSYSSIKDLRDTFALLADTLSDTQLNPERVKRAKECLDVCASDLDELQKKLRKLQTHTAPASFQQRALAGMQRSIYPFRASTLAKLREIGNELQRRLSLALQALHLELDVGSRSELVEIRASVERTAAHYLAIEESLARLSTHNKSITNDIHSLLSQHRKDRFRAIVDWLSPPDPSSNHVAARKKHQPETGQWLLESQRYKNWRNASATHLWLHGKSGCGKTILFSTMIQDIGAHCETSANDGYATFYFSFTEARKQTYDGFLISVVAQLGWKNPGFAKLAQLFDSNTKGLPGSKTLEEILFASIAQFDRLFLCLDALDECTEVDDSRTDMFDCLGRALGKLPNLKLLTTSRDLAKIRDFQIDIGAIDFPVNNNSVNDDIQKYIAAQMTVDRTLCRFDKQMKELIETTLLRKADGMFRWAFCQLQELKKLKSTKRRYVQHALHCLPTSLDATYERMLCNIEPVYHSDAKNLLRWLVFATRPLTLDEIVEANAIDPSGNGLVDVDDRGTIEDVLEILSGLVVVNKVSVDRIVDPPYNNSISGPKVYDKVSTFWPANRSGRRILETSEIRLAHSSVQEYLVSTRILESEVKTFHLEDAEVHRHLAQSCLTYLEFHHSTQLKSRRDIDLTAFPLLQYAAANWYWHSRLQFPLEFSRETTLLSTADRRKAWLLVHTPDPSQHSPDSDTDSSQMLSGLYCACCIGLDVVASELIANGADVNAKEGYLDGGPLGIAIQMGHPKVVKVLADNKVDINRKLNFYTSFLFLALRVGNHEVIETLVGAGGILRY